MKRKELQAPCLQVFQARARLKLGLITMPSVYRLTLSKAINEVELPLREVAKVSKQEAWSIYTRRLISVMAGISATTESKRILKEYRELLNI